MEGLRNIIKVDNHCALDGPFEWRYKASPSAKVKFPEGCNEASMRVILKEWRAGDDKLVTIFNRLVHQQDNGGNQCVTLESDPRGNDCLRETRGQNAKSRAITTPGDKKLDNCDETLLNASEVTSFRL